MILIVADKGSSLEGMLLFIFLSAVIIACFLSAAIWAIKNYQGPDDFHRKFKSLN